MNDATASLNGIYDIEPPTEPLLYIVESSTIDITVPFLFITAFLITVALILRKRNVSTKIKSRREIARIYRDLISQRINNHDAACQLSRLLQQSLGLDQSLLRTELPAEIHTHKIRWDRFTMQLSVACYSSTGEETEKLSTLFNDAIFWLKAWPNKKHD